ncbi:hypothetical protein G9F31_09960 [Acinetobacter sp. 187]|uniref:hypothetical protein n=1 Tax=Acinetobacter lanii TaxID=2715163 RepID=UPI001409DBDB|nr:hypothetical protein [Acinetobacter lanii]NHC04091.1 hypothetical protein [Acinetobacter lanii]
MSLTKQNAEQSFREAFKRLKSNNPKILPLNSPVTQNNIAREAGRDPSALKKDRYPLLILEIQAYIQSKTEENQVKKKSTDNRSLTIQKKLANSRQQIDKLSSIVVAQNETIQNLLNEIDLLKKVERN